MENALLPNIRIRKITLKDFRNIRYSEIEIPNAKINDIANEQPSILGLYGQNGSGKTSLILAISLLRTLLIGKEVKYSQYASCVRAGCTESKIEFEFSSINEKGVKYDIFYSFILAREETFDENDGDYSIPASNEAIIDEPYQSNIRMVIKDEILQYASENNDGEKRNKQIMIDTSEKACLSTGLAFGNKTKYEHFTINSRNEIHEKLRKWKYEASIRSTSFIFHRNVIKSLIQGTDSLSNKLILQAMQKYGNNYLFIIGTTETAINYLKSLPLAIWSKDENTAIGKTVLVELGEQCQVQEYLYTPCVEAVKSLNRVLETIVPGLSIQIGDIGKSRDKYGNEIHLFYIISDRRGVLIPFSFESDGIRRIVSFLSLLIAVYNNPSVTVAIDEIDSGIFEYMLGEILSVLGESAKGQLIFTSHNLRPLEVLPPKCLLFTTVNPDRKFAKLEGISGNNNLRDCYFRTIDLGVGKDAFYDATDTFSIEQALYEAGHQEE